MRIFLRLLKEIKEHIFQVIRVPLKWHFTLRHVILSIETYWIKILFQYFHLIFLHLLIVFILFREVTLFDSLPLWCFLHVLKLLLILWIELCEFIKIVRELFDIFIGLFYLYNWGCFINSDPLLSSLGHHIRPLVITFLIGLFEFYLLNTL